MKMKLIATWVGVIHNLDGSEIRSGRGWGANLGALDGVETGHWWT